MPYRECGTDICVYLTLGNEKNGMATMISNSPHNKKPNHHIPINRLSDGSIMQQREYFNNLFTQSNLSVSIYQY
jgi:hypothetical protein